MYRFIESIRWENGEMPLIDLHQQRFEKTQAEAFGRIIYDSLKEIIYADVISHQNISVGKFKCRVVYDDKNISVEFIPYRQSKINKLKIVIDDQIDYHLKYADRECFERLRAGLDKDTEILIVKNNLITDTSFTNIALFNESKWLTPASPLLAGVQRTFLINEKIIFAEEIKLNELHHFRKIKMFNAMMNWEEGIDLDIAYL